MFLTAPGVLETATSEAVTEHDQRRRERQQRRAVARRRRRRGDRLLMRFCRSARAARRRWRRPGAGESRPFLGVPPNLASPLRRAPPFAQCAAQPQRNCTRPIKSGASARSRAARPIDQAPRHRRATCRVRRGAGDRVGALDGTLSVDSPGARHDHPRRVAMRVVSRRGPALFRGRLVSLLSARAALTSCPGRRRRRPGPQGASARHRRHLCPDATQ